MKCIAANSNLFQAAKLDFAKLGIDQVEIHLGINPAFICQLVGEGEVPCWCVGRDGEGKFPGMANSPGFVVRLPFDGLRDLGFSVNDLFLACGANRAERMDAYGGEPVCADCQPASGGKLGRKLRGKTPRACWSCSEMIAESWRDDSEW